MRRAGVREPGRRTQVFRPHSDRVALPRSSGRREEVPRFGSPPPRGGQALLEGVVLVRPHHPELLQLPYPLRRQVPGPVVCALPLQPRAQRDPARHPVRGRDVVVRDLQLAVLRDLLRVPGRGRRPGPPVVGLQVQHPQRHEPGHLRRITRRGELQELPSPLLLVHGFSRLTSRAAGHPQAAPKVASPTPVVGGRGTASFERGAAACAASRASSRAMGGLPAGWAARGAGPEVGGHGGGGVPDDVGHANSTAAERSWLYPCVVCPAPVPPVGGGPGVVLPGFRAVRTFGAQCHVWCTTIGKGKPALCGGCSKIMMG